MKTKLTYSDKLERWKQKEPLRWWFEFVFKVLAILLPFVFIWITNELHVNRQRQLEADKTKRLMDLFHAEIMQNFELLDRTVEDDTSKKALDPKIDISPNGVIVFHIPNMEFPTNVWNIAITSDLVLKMSSGFYDTLNILYTTFTEFNRSLSKLQEYRESAYLRRAEGKVLTKDFITTMKTTLRDAKLYLDVLRQGQPMIKKYIDSQLEKVKSSL